MTFHPRVAWGARYAPARIVAVNQRTTFFLHHTVVESPADHGRCAAVIRQIESQHHAQWGFTVGYQHVVCQHGDVFEGCGWDRLGQQAEKANTYSVGVAYLGDGRKTVPRPAIVGLRERYHAANAHFGRTLTLRGHRDLKPTNCPGDRLYAEMGALLVPPTGDDDMTPEEHEMLVETHIASESTNIAMGRVEMEVRDPTNGIAARLARVEAKLDALDDGGN